MGEPPNAARFVVGIDLGTTNSAVAYVDTQEDRFATHSFAIPQLVAPGETESRETFPSFHYEPARGELPPEALRLPWERGEPCEYVLGVFARDQGANVPGRLIVSAKSWLCHTGVDRTADLLPWHGAPDATKLAPAEVSARYLRHLRTAWDYRFPGFPLEAQDVVVTIPASFDEVARELTLTAARRAGLPRVVLLEEPQAAFYAWSRQQGGQSTLRPGQKILVCDVGGGTSDFSLIEVRPGEGGEVQFHRFAVGDHLILGGDNLDLALAHFVEERLKVELQPRQWSVLVRRCQQAKELLLGPSAPDRLTLSVPADGSRLIGGALQVEVTRAEVTKLLLEGFLPLVGLRDTPTKARSGFQEFGLPYAPDPAITRHLAAFLNAHQTDAGARPDVILFNGGLFQSPLMRQRLLEVLYSWFSHDDQPPWQPRILENSRLDLAVAIGAAHYGMVRRGTGSRITGGLARAYYIGVKGALENIAVCLVPAGLEPGEEINLLNQEFDLLVRQPAEFPLYVSSSRTTDQPGAIVTLNAEQFSALPPIRTVLRSKTDDVDTVPVHLHAQLTEIGTLDVWCSESHGSRKWKLQFDVRAATHTRVAAPTQPSIPQNSTDNAPEGFPQVLLQVPPQVPPQVAEECSELIRETFHGNSPGALAETLVKRMEKAAGLGRWEWPPSLLRRLWDELLAVEPGRHRTALHEARWLNLLGFSLRPGYGFALDDWRVAQTWRFGGAERKIVHPRNELCCAEWWILWRRIAGGLTAGQQKTISDPLLALLRKAHAREEVPWGSHESAEVWRMLGSFERLSCEVKIALGDFLLDHLARGKSGASERAAVWALGRLGARVPMYGPLNTVVPAENAEKWIQAIIHHPLIGEEKLFTLTQLSRRTHDRYRDISEAVRQQVLNEMKEAAEHFLTLIQTGGTLQQEEQELAFGEALPYGLQILE